MAKTRLNIVRDTREQDGCGWFFNGPNFDPQPIVKIGTLTTGDYSLDGHESCVAVERKDMQDLVGCLGSGRERFERELERMRAMDSAVVVVEGPQRLLQDGQYRGALNPVAAWQSILSFSARYRVPFLFARDKWEAESFAFDFLRHYAAGVLRKLNALKIEG